MKSDPEISAGQAITCISVTILSLPESRPYNIPNAERPGSQPPRYISLTLSLFLSGSRVLSPSLSLAREKKKGERKTNLKRQNHTIYVILINHFFRSPYDLQLGGARSSVRVGSCTGCFNLVLFAFFLVEFYRTFYNNASLFRRIPRFFFFFISFRTLVDFDRPFFMKS